MASHAIGVCLWPIPRSAGRNLVKAMMSRSTDLPQPRSTDRVDRRWFGARLSWLAFGLALPALSACAATPPGTRSYTLPQAELQSLIDRRFPYRRSLSGLLDIALLHPRMRLLPQENRLGTQLDIAVAERVMGTRYDGSMDLDYGLRFEPQDRTIRLVGVRVHRVEFPGVPPAYSQALAQAAPRAAEQLLEGAVLHEVKADQLALLGGLGLAVGEVRVTPQGLRVELVPGLGKP